MSDDDDDEGEEDEDGEDDEGNNNDYDDDDDGEEEEEEGESDSDSDGDSDGEAHSKSECERRLWWASGEGEGEARRDRGVGGEGDPSAALGLTRKRFNVTRVWGKRVRGGGVDVRMLSQPRRTRLGIVDCLAQESRCFRRLLHKIQFETGVFGASGVQQLLEAYSTMGRAFAGGPPKLDEPSFVGGEGGSELQLRRLNDMEMLIAFQNRLCVDMGCVIASGAASPAELCQDVKKYYLGEGFQRWECSLGSPVYAW